MLSRGGRARGTLSPRPPAGRGGGARVYPATIPVLLLIQAQVPGRLPNRIEGLPGDSVSLRKPPLPGGVADMVRQIMDVPQALQIAGAVVAVLVLAGLVAIAWWQRAELLAWFTMRARRTVLAAGTVAFVAIAGIGWFSVRSWNYMMHDNDFCSGCHVMAPAWQKFQTTKHAQLQCHQCHQQSIFASARQLMLWVADRPGQIPAHAKVPNARCIACHVKGDPARWKQIAATEGHRLHLESPELPGLQCVRCHGFSVHQFVPTDMTCGQAGCHTNIRIRLGKMTRVTSLHCVMCHVFTRRAAAPMSVRDSLRSWLTPTRTECFSCHAMQKLMVDQQLAHDPHGAVCGACHNPHTQTQAAQALRSCTKAGCHGRPDTRTAAHRGLEPAALASCTSCHTPHSWKTMGRGDCTACHGNIFNSGGRTGPAKVSAAPAPMPWGRLYGRLRAAMASPDPVAAFARGAGRPAPRAPTPGVSWRAARPTAFPAPPLAAAGADPARTGPPIRLVAWRAASPQQPQQPQQPQLQRPAAQEPKAGRAPPPATPPAGPTVVQAGPYRGFSHAVHRNVACTGCPSMQSAHGTLRIRSVEDCMRCHHAPSIRVACTGCHAPATLPQGLQRTVTVRTSVAPAAATRTLPFSHSAHPDVPCGSCHGGPPTLRTIATCASCHDSHHTAARECRTCHTESVLSNHDAAAHVTCGGAGCHRDPAVDRLGWSREVCLACHPTMAKHNPGLACAGCHAVPALHGAASDPAGTGG